VVEPEPEPVRTAQVEREPALMDEAVPVMVAEPVVEAAPELASAKVLNALRLQREEMLQRFSEPLATPLPDRSPAEPHDAGLLQRVEHWTYDEAATTARIQRRREELVFRRTAQAPRLAPAPAPAVAPPTSVGTAARERRRGHITRSVAGVLLVVAAVAVVGLAQRGTPGGVLGVRGSPATSTPSGTAVQESGAGRGLTAPGPTSAASLPPGSGAVGSAVTPSAAAPSPLATSAVGTARGPSPSPSARRARPTPAGPCGTAGCVAYVVRPGDTLGRIAGRFGVSIPAILAANPQVLDPNLVVTGQVLRIPSPTP
jgi:hypothetical protein